MDSMLDRRTLLKLGAAGAAALASPAGSVAAFQLGTGQGWVVLRVLDRTADGPPPAPEASATARLDQQTLAEVGVRLLTPVALRTGVELNPRYGTWDPVRMIAVPAEEETSLVLPTAAPATAPAG